MRATWTPSTLYTRIRAVCGAECLLDPEGEPLPDDFDFEQLTKPAAKRRACADA
jgi:hypothetical protein